MKRFKKLLTIAQSVRGRYKCGWCGRGVIRRCWTRCRVCRCMNLRTDCHTDHRENVARLSAQEFASRKEHA